jgi:N-acetylneuraminic acid mutarotase
MNKRFAAAISLAVVLMLLVALPAQAARRTPPTTPAVSAAFDGSQADAPLVAQQMTGGGWTLGAPIPVGRYLMAGATTTGCTFFAIGGLISGTSASTSVDVYNPANNTWTARAPLPLPLGGLQAANIGTRIYVVGGYGTGLAISNANNIYDALTNSWSTGAPLPNPGGIATAAEAAYNGKVYVIGGDDGDSNSNTTNYEYDPATNTWATRAAMPTPRENNVAVTLNGKIYVAGGITAQVSLDGLRTFESYDPVANTWATLPLMADPRISPGIATDGTYVYVYGGSTSYSGGSDLTSVERYDPVANTWTTLPDAMVQATNGAAAGFALGRLFSVGGAFPPITVNQYSDLGVNNCAPTSVTLAGLQAETASNATPTWLLPVALATALGLGLWLRQRRLRSAV